MTWEQKAMPRTVAVIPESSAAAAGFICTDIYLYISLFVGSSVGMAGATGWMAGARFPAGARDLFPLRNIETGSGAHPASYPVDIGDP
jgi:hypothetical protein